MTLINETEECPGELGGSLTTMFTIRIAAIVALSVVSIYSACAGTVAPIFSSKMVLQRDADIAVFGSAEEGVEVTVRFAGQTKTVAAAGGKWKLFLDPLPASPASPTLTISSSSG